jgi:hypothetical protein
MTDRYNTLTVALENDIRDDDAEALISAIKQLRGVLTVTGNVVDGREWLIEQRVRHELEKKLWQVLYPK